MKILSLFDGISCARVALERAGISVEDYYASEIDKYAIQISTKNYPEIKQIGDVKSLYPSNLWKEWKIDLLIGGSPCQDLSIAKKDRKGLDGERSGLFWEYVRILNKVKPKYFILENVNSMPKEAKDIISETLGVEPIMINASLVSAQNRKRLFWTNIPNVKLPEDKGILLKDILESNVDEKYFIGKDFKIGKSQGNSVHNIENKSVCLKALGGGGGAKTGLYKVGNVNPSGKGMNGDVHSVEGKSPTLTTNKGEGQKIAIGVASRTYPRTKIEGIERSKQIEFRNDEKANSMTLVQGDSMVAIDIPNGSSLDYYNRKIVPNGKAKVLGTNPQSTTAVAGQLVNDNLQIRKLTPIECERLQGLPDNYTDGISNTQRYKACGNAFNVDVVAHILSFIPVDKVQ